LAVEYAHLLVTADRPVEALAVLEERRFQPWEGGEGQVLRAWGDPALWRRLLCSRATRLQPSTMHGPPWRRPESLGEARHPLANPAQLLLVLSTALEADNDPDGAVRCWREAAERAVTSAR
jgi:hypothetical protein